MAEARTRLFRAVTKPELDSIRERLAFWNPVGIEVKYFSTTLAGAKSYSLRAAAAFCDGPFSFVATTLLMSLIADEMLVLVDGSIRTVVLSSNHLQKLSRPVILVLPEPLRADGWNGSR